jgi:hypothetical protein
MASVLLIRDTGHGFDIHPLASETSGTLLDVLVIKEHDDKRHLASSPPPDIDASTIRLQPNFLVPAAVHDIKSSDVAYRTVMIGR